MPIPSTYCSEVQRNLFTVLENLSYHNNRSIRSQNTVHRVLLISNGPLQCTAAEVISIDELLNSPTTQKMLSTKIENKLFQLLFANCNPNRACLMSGSSNLAASWLSVIPSPGLNLHLDTAESQTALKWWLGIDMFGCSSAHLVQPSH